MIEHLLPPQASAHAVEIDRVLTLVHWLMAILLVGWGAYFLWVLFRFRSGRQPRADHRGATGRFAFWTEIGVVVAEGVLLVVIALPVWFARTSAAPVTRAPLVVQVVAEQFVWNIRYPGPDGEFGATAIRFVSPTNPVGLDRSSPNGRDDVVVQNQLHLPIGRSVLVQLSSKDVIHSFGVPAMRVKRDAVPGVFAPVWFTPTLMGQFDVACSQLCGLAHYRMRAIVTVESEEAFARFLAAEAPTQ